MFKILIVNKKFKGSFTVEAALILPLILFVMFAIVYLSITHYQNAVMETEALRAMNRAGAYWQYVDMNEEGEKTSGIPTVYKTSIAFKDIISSKMIEKRNPYRSILDLIAKGADTVSIKKMNVTQYINTKVLGTKLQHHNIDEKIVVDNIDRDGYIFFGDDLKIDISRSYKSPLAIFENNVLNKDNAGKKKNTETHMNKKIIVPGVISNQAEFIRNIDSIYNIAASLCDMIKNNIEK